MVGLGMNIRAARINDKEALASIAMAAKASWGYSLAQVEAWRGELSPTVESILSQPTFVAESNGDILGFYQLMVHGDVADLEHLWVHPNRMRQGIGRALVLHAVEYASKNGMDSLAIDSEPHAERFYESCGACRVFLCPAPIEGQPHRVRPQMVLSIPAI